MTVPNVAGQAATVQRLQPFAVNIFAAMSALAARLEAVNLGQGFPDEDGPPAMLEAAQQAIAHGVNQYPPGPGILALRQATLADTRRRHATWPAERTLRHLAVTAAALIMAPPGED